MEMTEAIFKAVAIGASYSAVGLAAVGSAIGIGVAGQSAIGAWKKCYQQGKAAPFLLLALVSAPLSQTIYAVIQMILMNGNIEKNPMSMPAYVLIALAGGMAQMVSAMFQGRCAANACVAFAETDKGFSNYLTVLGVVETCAIFALIMSLLAMP